MIPQVLSHYQLPILSCVGLLLFMGVFTGVLVWIFRGGSRAIYESFADMPMREKDITGSFGHER